MQRRGENVATPGTIAEGGAEQENTSEDRARDRKRRWRRIVNIVASGAMATVTVGAIQVWHNQEMATGQLQHNQQMAKEAAFLNILQIRIANCVELAAHHRLQWQTYGHEVHEAKLILVDENYDPVLDRDGRVQPVAQSTNRERFEASIKMARELNMCLALKAGFAELQTCTENATHRQRSKRVLDDVTGESNPTPVGRWNPAC